MARGFRAEQGARAADAAASSLINLQNGGATGARPCERRMLGAACRRSDVRSPDEVAGAVVRREPDAGLQPQGW